MKRFSFPTILLLGFYLFYSLCPLLYSVGMARAEEGQGNNWRPAAAGHPISTEWSQAGVRSEIASDSWVLLTKKRAISASFRGLVNKPPLSPVNNAGKILSTIVAQPEPQEATTCPDGFHYYHSGLSPPLLDASPLFDSSLFF